MAHRLAHIARYAEGGVINQDVEPWRRIPTAGESKMEAEPGWMEKLARSVISDPNNVAPMPWGVVMKGPNAAVNTNRLLDQIKRYLPQGADATPMEQARAYMAAKYPKLYRMAADVDLVPPSYYESPEVGGEYTGLSPRQTGKAGPITIADDSPRDIGVQSLGHELTHGIQDARSQMVRENPTSSRLSLSGPGLPRTPEDSGPFLQRPGQPSPYTVQTDMHKYSNNPYEVQARQGGRTALNTYDDFNENLIQKFTGQGKVPKYKTAVP